MSKHIIEHFIVCPACSGKLKLRLDVALADAQEGEPLHGCCGDDLQHVPHRTDAQNAAAQAELDHAARVLAQSQAAKAPLVQATPTLNVTPTRWDVR